MANGAKKSGKDRSEGDETGRQDLFAPDVGMVPPQSAGSDFLDADAVSGMYLHVLEHPVLHRDHLAHAGYLDREIDVALRLFEWRGLVQRMDEDSWRVLPPDVSMPSFAARLEEHARQLRASAPTLARVYERGEGADENLPRGVVELRGINEIGRAVQGVISTTESRLIGIRTDTPHTRRQLRLPSAYHTSLPVNSHGDPLTVQVIYDLALLDVDGFGHVLQQRLVAGEDQRIASRVPFSLTANDTGHVVVDVSGSDGQAAGVLLTSAASGAAAERIFQFAWQLGTPWKGSDAPDRILGPSARDVEIVRLMASGASDSTISRQLGISQRTVERRVKAYLDSVNAATRFQAGVMAAKQGLV